MSDATKQKLFWWFVEHLKAVATIITATGIILGMVVFIFEPHAARIIRELVGTENMLSAVEQQKREIQKQREYMYELSVSVNGLNERMNEIAPRRVAEYDILRSKIFSPCARGELCKYTYRVRRTDWGESCGKPQMTYIFEDAAGVVFYPRKQNEMLPTRLTKDWSSVASGFYVPEGAMEGFGEFYLLLEYENCWKEKSEAGTQEKTMTEVIEYSTPLVVKVTRKGTDK